MREPLVSIITPCYNVEKYIGEYLDSVLSQTYDNIEFILVDDGSTDKTKEIIDSYRDKIKKRGFTFKYIHKENGGHASALNEGFAVFQGKYFTWPDADDVLHKDNVKVKVDFLEENLDYGFVRGKRRYFNQNIENLGKPETRDNLADEKIFFDLIQGNTFTNGGCYLMRTELFLKAYPNRTIFSGLGSQNWQILLPAASTSKCGFIDKEIFFIRVYPESFSRRKRTLEEMFLRMDDHKNILFDSFLHSDCDIEECKRLVEIKYARRKYYYAYYCNNREIVTEYYKILKDLTKLTGKDIIIYLITRNKYLLIVSKKAALLLKKSYRSVKNIFIS